MMITKKTKSGTRHKGLPSFSRSISTAPTDILMNRTIRPITRRKTPKGPMMILKDNQGRPSMQIRERNTIFSATMWWKQNISSLFPKKMHRKLWVFGRYLEELGNKCFIPSSLMELITVGDLMRTLTWHYKALYA